MEQIPARLALIDQLQQSSRNPDTPALMGGHAFMGREIPAEILGAKQIAVDAFHELVLATLLVFFRTNTKPYS